MHSVRLSITTPATDLSILTESELRQATGVASGQSDAITALGKAVAAAITSRCNIRGSGAVPPTLRMETLTQTFRLDCAEEQLILWRRPVLSITSVVEDDVAVDAADVEVEEPAFLKRLNDDVPTAWLASKITVVYIAGWETVPANLRSAAMKLAKVLWTESSPGDPNAKSIVIPGVYEVERWVSQGDDPLMSREIDELLADYIYPAVG